MVRENMKIKKLIKYYLLGESLKEIELNRILDKISRKKKLTEREMNYLELYQTTREEEMKDLMLLSKNSACNRISLMIEDGKKVICDLNDRDGRIGLQIVEVENNHQDETCVVRMRGGASHMLDERFLYNIIYNQKKDSYSLQEHDEYHEKIEAKHGDD